MKKVPDCALKSLNTNWLCSELLIAEQRLTSFNKFKGCKWWCHVFRHGKERERERELVMEPFLCTFEPIRHLPLFSLVCL